MTEIPMKYQTTYQWQAKGVEGVINIEGLIFPRITGHRVKGYRMTRNEVSNEQKTQKF
jgi:hypothetical protein